MEAGRSPEVRLAGVGRIVSPYVSKLELKLYLWMGYPWLNEDRV